LGCELFPWLQALYPIWSRLAPDALDLVATVAMAELLLSGCSMNRSQRNAGLPPDSVVQRDDAILADRKRLIAGYHDASPAGGRGRWCDPGAGHGRPCSATQCGCEGSALGIGNA
jgi:hypothetical protein